MRIANRESTMYKKILIPIDHDAPEIVERSLGVAQALANADGGAQLRLINVQPLVPVSLLGYLPPSFDEDMQKEAEKKLAEISGKLSWRLRLSCVTAPSILRFLPKLKTGGLI
jgi:nucleotide-binding universal stress UspA family protein